MTYSDSNFDQTYPLDKASRILYRIGGYTAFLFLLYSIATILIFITIGKGYPESASECFSMLKENKFTALLRLDIVSVIIIPFYYILFYAIYRALKLKYEMLAKISLFLTLAGITIFITGLNISSIITLSEKYYSTTDPKIRQQLLAACEGMLASDMWISTSAVIRGIMIETGALIFSFIMLKTNVFKTYVAWIGIFTHSFDLLSELGGIFNPASKEIFTMLAGPLYIAWFIAIGIQFFQIRKRSTTPLHS